MAGRTKQASETAANLEAIMRTVLGIYQAIDPDHPLRAAVLTEAIAFHDDETIMGYQIQRTTNMRSTGTTSYGMAMNAQHMRIKASDLISGYYTTAIEPYDDSQWSLHVYERNSIEVMCSSIHANVNDAMLAGRKILQKLARRTNLRQLIVGQWFAFKIDHNDWSECYQYNGNGWYGRVYSGGPWHKADETLVFVLSDEETALCEKQKQALIDEYNKTPLSDYEEGWGDATLDASSWTKEQAIAYLDSVAELDDDYDRGHRAAIKHLHGLQETHS